MTGNDLDLSVGGGRTGDGSDARATALAPGTVLAGRYEIRARSLRAS